MMFSLSLAVTDNNAKDTVVEHGSYGQDLSHLNVLMCSVDAYSSSTSNRRSHGKDFQLRVGVRVLEKVNKVLINYLGRINDAGLDHVDILALGGVVTHVGVFGLDDLVDDH